MTPGVHPPPLIGESRAMQRVRGLVQRFGPTRLPVLLVGPTGVGKDLIAQHLHVTSGRRGLWVPVNCGALPREMADSLLFGHRRGAFSGAVESRVGHFERSGGGTLFLDEVFTLPEETQVKFLRALEDGEVQPLGEESRRMVDLRVVAAMQEDAAERVQSGRFRRDLFRRLAGVVIEVPAIVDRVEDVVPLARYFTELQGRTLEPNAEQALIAYEWPDNVRELRQAIERAGHLVENGTLSAAAIAEAIHLGAPAGVPSGPSDSLREEMIALCAAQDWDARRIALELGVGRTALFQRLRKVGLSLRALRESAQSAKVRGLARPFQAPGRETPA